MADGIARTLREAPICAVAVSKLRNDGWRVACEIPIFDFRSKVDAVGIRDGKVKCIEAKTSLNNTLRRQLYRSQLVADYVLAVVGKQPHYDSIEWCKEQGIGLWVIVSEEILELV